MSSIGDFIGIVYAIVCFGICIYLVYLASQFVSAHEKMADALEKIAKQKADDGKA